MEESPSSAGSDSRLAPIILLGLGFTTSRLARRLLLRGAPVFSVVRRRSRFSDLTRQGLRVEEYATESLPHLPKDAVLIHTIPPLAGEELVNLRSFICALRPRRVLYISSTSVYGDQLFVNAETAAAPSDPKGRGRVDEEAWLHTGQWSNLILRPAAIYGPGRGMHVRIREGKPPRVTGSTVVSRIHVDDLAALLDASVTSALKGAWPCADEHPCSTDEIGAWCAKLLGVKTAKPAENLPVAGRTVDGRAIREVLSTGLIYPDYASGILASLAQETINAPQPAKG